MAASRPMSNPLIPPLTDPATVSFLSSTTTPPQITGTDDGGPDAVAAVASAAADLASRGVSFAVAEAGGALRNVFRPRNVIDAGSELVARKYHKNKKERQMDQGAIAGTVIGSVLAIALIIFCLYPFVARRIIRRRNARLKAADTEAGIGPGHPNYQTPRRLSSSDSSRENVPRSKPSGRYAKKRGSKAQGLAPPEALYNPRTYSSRQPPAQASDLEVAVSHGFAASRSNTFDSAADGQVAHGEQDQGSTLPFPPFDGEYYPASHADNHPGILQGTSADYYCPSIPSEAFGMLPEPEQLTRPERSVSRSSSLRYNVRSMLRRKSGRDRTLSSQTSTEPSGDDYTLANDVPHLHGAMPMHRIITDEEPTASPIEASPTAMSFPPLPEQPENHIFRHQPLSRSAPSDTQSSPRSPQLGRRFAPSPSPSHAAPAPGTVNPMHIMPAMTQSERFYQTEQELFISTYDSSPSPAPPAPMVAEPPQIHYAPIITSPSPSPGPSGEPPKASDAPNPSLLQPRPLHESFEREDVAMKDSQSQNYLSPVPTDQGRRCSYTSEGTSPLPGPASTVPSSQNTPSTQLDTPSPDSLGSSDLRHSASPPIGLSVSSPTAGIYRCDEPGCGQVFGQPHKLKHHQRYHSKEHKCAYPECGKGFGTKTHLQRHINDKHDKKKKFHCSIQGCDYSRAGGKAFPRKDNWKRHMTKIHKIGNENLPEPIEIDQEMSGT